MTALRILEQDLRQRLHDIHVRLYQLHPRASAEIADDMRRDDLCDSAQAIGALEAETMSVERLTLAAQRITATLEAGPKREKSSSAALRWRAVCSRRLPELSSTNARAIRCAPDAK